MRPFSKNLIFYFQNTTVKGIMDCIWLVNYDSYGHKVILKYNWTGYYIIMWERYARVHVYTGVKTILQVVIFLEFSLESLISALRNFKTEIFVLDYRFWIPNQCSNSHFVIQKFKPYPLCIQNGPRRTPNELDITKLKKVLGKIILELTKILNDFWVVLKFFS